jgi:hypothetical protein
MSPTSIRIALLAFAVSTMTAGSVQALADAPHGGKPSAPGKSAQDRRMTLAPQKPNGSGIVVRYRVDATPQTGKTVPIAVSLERITGSDATVRFEGGPGLQLDAGRLPRALEAGRPAALTVDVVPDHTGLSYLHVFTTQDGITSVASIPVQVGKGDASLPPVGQLKSTPDGGDKILSIPVK